MREIKFRAWNKETRVMADLKKLTPLALDAGMNTQLAMQGCDGLFIPFFPNLELVQYTGLKDKNGIEIYEGDVLHSHNSSWIVKYDKDMFVCDGPNLGSPRLSYCLKFRERAGIPLEVVGNIHQNPELLKGA